MADGAVCVKCQKGRMQNGTCTVCGFREAVPSSMNALANGQRVCGGRYVTQRVLGEGGYGITYEAWDYQERRRVALKEFFPRFAVRRSQNGRNTVCMDTKMEETVAHARLRFNEEANLLFNLKHVKEIVDVYHCFEDNNTAYYTMELLQGMDMQKYLRMHGPMTWPALAPIVISILRALYVTHSIGYIHRDITPDNIFLLDHGGVRLIDFGNARRYKTNQQLTAVVKEKFAPPEQYSRMGNQGPWTDIYSLCVTIYYALTGILPQKAQADPLPPLQTKLANIPAEVSKAVQIGMLPEENRRYQSVANFAYAMFPQQAILGGLTMPSSQKSHLNQGFGQRTPTAPKPQEPPRSNPGRQTATGGSRPELLCTQGIMQGFRMALPLGSVLALGRGDSNQIQYPEKASGISRNQCSFLFHANGSVLVRDDNSRYGTFVNGNRLAPLQWKPLNRGDTVRVGNEIYLLR